MNKRIRTLLLFAIPLTLTVGLVVLAWWYAAGHSVPVLQPRGDIASRERELLIVALLLSALVVVPVFTLTVLFAWKYRETNPKPQQYRPDWAGNKLYESIWWGIPIVIVGVLSVITWITSHSLDPYKQLDSAKKPIHVQVVALDWKWLFIYPEEHVASVNQMAVPVGRPVNFEITSDTVMNSFWIPQLGSQIYAMPGMSTKLHLIADRRGEYYGSAANISGSGFSSMNFRVEAMPEEGYRQWLTKAQGSRSNLTMDAYHTLAKPSKQNKVRYYAPVQDGLYSNVVMKYMSMESMSDDTEANSAGSRDADYAINDHWHGRGYATMMLASIFGRLNWDALPDALITQGAAASIVLGTLAAVAAMTYFKKWGWLWREWITTTNHKKIGVMYIVVALVMLLRGLADALMMRTQQALSVGDSQGVLTSDTFQQVFSAHGTIMIFFVAMGLMFGLINLVLPQQLGSRDVAFPFLNSASFWLFASGMILINMSLVLGEFSAAGWLAYPPLSEATFSPGVGVDYWIWSLQIAGIGSLLSGVNFITTILKMRAKGMALMKMPLFAWSVFGSMTLVVVAFPILTVTLTLLFLDRAFGMHFFTADGGGNAMMYINLIWAWGHPEVYILVLPAFGAFSEIVATFSRKRLFGYTSMVYAIWGIVFLSFTVWLHHFFTMGAGANVNAFFGIMTMAIAVPTGVKIFNWLFTMYKGRIWFASPMIWFIGFMFLFTIGGVTGVLLAVPAIDFQVHNSLFLVAHFHNMIISGVVFGFMAALTYWFPKITGFMLNETLGKIAAWCWIVGFVLAFFPLYILGFMGATRRLDHYEASLGWQPLFIVAGIGALIICAGVGVQLIQFAYSIWKRNDNRDTTGDPWNGRTLEWATASPTQEYNFAVLPEVTERDAFWEMKQSGQQATTATYHDIMVPRNTPTGFFIGVSTFVVGFAAIWHIWWLLLVAITGVLVVVMRHTLSENDTERMIPADEVARTEALYRKEGKQ